MHLDSCLVELALNKDKLASLPQKARKISLWKMERVVRGKGPRSAYYLFLSLKDIFFMLPLYPPLSTLLALNSHAHSEESGHLNSSMMTW